jgi:hypothetical protein
MHERILCRLLFAASATHNLFGLISKESLLLGIIEFPVGINWRRGNSSYSFTN